MLLLNIKIPITYLHKPISRLSASRYLERKNKINVTKQSIKFIRFIPRNSADFIDLFYSIISIKNSNFVLL